MIKYILPFLLLLIIACGQEPGKTLSAHEIVDRAIDSCGGKLYRKSTIGFEFRDRTYEMENVSNKRVLKRITTSDSAVIVDIKKTDSFQRLINNRPANLADSLARKYGNSVNSVHYFAYLPYGLNDAAVNKKLLGETKIGDNKYYKMQVSFDKQGGGDDFEDVYIYWFNKETFKPDYLAYEFHVDGGGMRFREAYNERVVNGIRFVDYNNFKPKEEVALSTLDSLFKTGNLELLSKIELKNIRVTRDSYN